MPHRDNDKRTSRGTATSRGRSDAITTGARPCRYFLRNSALRGVECPDNTPIKTNFWGDYLPVFTAPIKRKKAGEMARGLPIAAAAAIDTGSG